MKFIRKLSTLVLVLIGVSILSFSFANISTIDSAEAIARRTYANPTEKQIDTIRHEIGLDNSLLKQYITWVQKCLHGDLGTSYLTNEPVLQGILKKLVSTLSIVGLSLFWIIIITIPLSIISAIKKNRLLDYLIRGITILGISIPSFWLGFLLLTAFGVIIPIFKVIDYGNLKSVILPSFTLAVPVICSSIKMLRVTILSNLKQDYVTYAKARGLPPRRILWCHVLKNALPPTITLFFQNIGYMIAGSAIVENVFSWPGIGMYFVNAIIQRDLAVINGCVLVIALVFVLCNSIGEIVSRLLNPHMDIRAEVIAND